MVQLTNKTRTSLIFFFSSRYLNFERTYIILCLIHQHESCQTKSTTTRLPVWPPFVVWWRMMFILLCICFNIIFKKKYSTSSKELLATSKKNKETDKNYLHIYPINLNKSDLGWMMIIFFVYSYSQSCKLVKYLNIKRCSWAHWIWCWAVSFDNKELCHFVILTGNIPTHFISVYSGFVYLLRRTK